MLWGNLKTLIENLLEYAADLMGTELFSANGKSITFFNIFSFIIAVYVFTKFIRILLGYDE